MALSCPSPWKVALALLVAGAAPARAVDQAEFRRYGFSRDFAGEVEGSRKYEVPATQASSVVPSPVIPGDLLDPKEIPGAPEYVARVVRQRQDVASPGVEGLVEGYPGEEHARAEEGTFREVEDFFLRPSEVYERVTSMNEWGQTGLAIMPTADIPRPGATYLRGGLAYTFYDRFGDTPLSDDRAIEQYLFALTYQSVPWKNLELSLQATGVNEEAENFPLIQQYEVFGVRDVRLNAKYRFYENPQSQVQAAVGFGLDVGVEEVPTRLGSNGVDYQLYLVGSKRMQNFGVHMRGGFVFPNGENRTNSGIPDIAQLDLGLDFSPSDRLTITGEVNHVNWRFLGDQTKITAGIKYRMSHRWSFDFGLPLKVSNSLAEDYRYRVLAAVQAQL